MGQLIMLGTLFGLIIVIFGIVIYSDPEARGSRDDSGAVDVEAAGGEADR